MLSDFVRRPEAKTRSFVSPSGAGNLLGCGLRTAYDSESAAGKSRIGSPATRLGTACHNVLELAAKGDFPEPAAPEWGDHFNASWVKAIEHEVEELRSLPGAGSWPEPERWPFYARRKAATKRVARKLCLELADSAIEALAEVPLETSDGLIRGRPDLVIRAPVHEIRDYKTGAVIEPATGDIRPEYLMQLLLYAVLEHASTGEWPSSGLLVPLEGHEVAVDLDPAEAGSLENTVKESLAAYNRVAESGGDPLQLARPSPEACRYCDHATECPAFWEAVNPEWEAGGVHAAAGVVTGVRVAARGSIAVDLDRVVGSVGSGPLSLTGIDLVEFPGASQIEVSGTLAAVGLYSKQEGYAEPSRGTRLGVWPPVPGEPA